MRCRTTDRRGLGRWSRALSVALQVLLLGPCLFLAEAGPAPVDLGSAAPFTILAGSAITSAGGTIDGDVGLSPTTGAAISGITTGLVNGIIYVIDAVGPPGSVMDPDLLAAAKNDLTAAYTNAEGRTPTTSYGAIYDLGGQTLTSGVYYGASSFGITGTLTLDAQGDREAVWIFQAVSSLITEPYSSVVLTNGAQARNVFWKVGSSATLKGYTLFKGTLMALTDITTDNYSVLDGRALAVNGAVTFNSPAGGLPILSISVSPSIWAAGTMAPGTNQSSTAGNRLTVTNDGTVAETFTLSISDEDDHDQWTHSPSKTGAGTNVYVLSALFCAPADSPSGGSFSQTASDDVLTTAEQDATATQFAYAEGTTNGVAVPAGEGRSLWLRMDTPTAGTGGIEHTMTIRVGCFQP